MPFLFLILFLQLKKKHHNNILTFSRICFVDVFQQTPTLPTQTSIVSVLNLNLYAFSFSLKLLLGISKKYQQYPEQGKGIVGMFEESGRKFCYEDEQQDVFCYLFLRGSCFRELSSSTNKTMMNTLGTLKSFLLLFKRFFFPFLLSV